MDPIDRVIGNALEHVAQISFGIDVIGKRGVRAVLTDTEVSVAIAKAPSRRLPLRVADAQE